MISQLIEQLQETGHYNMFVLALCGLGVGISMIIAGMIMKHKAEEYEDDDE